MRVALSDKYHRGALLVLENVGLPSPKTALLQQKLHRLGLGDGNHKVMVIGSDRDGDGQQLALKQAAASVEGVHVTVATRATVYDLVRASLLIVSREAAGELERRFERDWVTLPTRPPMQAYYYGLGDAAAPAASSAASATSD